MNLPLIIFFLQALHVFGDMTTIDIFLQDLGVKVLALNVIAGEALLIVRYKDTTIASALHGAEHAATGTRTTKSNVEIRLERPWCLVIIQSFGDLEFSVGFSNAFVLVCETQLGQRSAGSKQASRVGSGPIGKTMVDTIARQFFRRGGDKNKITLKASVDDLDNDLLVGETDNEAVLWRIAWYNCQMGDLSLQDGKSTYYLFFA